MRGRGWVRVRVRVRVRVKIRVRAGVRGRVRGDALTDGGLAYAGRSDEAKDLALGRAAQGADCDELHDALLVRGWG